ncbi:MAG: hypothetical protein ACK52I_25780 [Pseudomonadota bacterium]
MNPPALRQAMRDRRLRHAAFPVLFYLWDAGVLDMVAWRMCKGDALADAVGFDRATCYRALDDLRRAGYVERHTRDVSCYRLVWAPVVAAVRQTAPECDSPAADPAAYSARHPDPVSTCHVS